jgi:Kdo2-lipid IVA lauroyltransferase/acyltransferase
LEKNGCAIPRYIHTKGALDAEGVPFLEVSVGKKIKNSLIYYSSRLFMLILLRVPAFCVAPLGRAFGWLVFGTISSERRKMLGNMRTAYPGWTDKQALKMAEGVWTGLGQNLFEVVRWMALTREQVVSQVARVEGTEYLQEALGKGRGVIVVTGHLGNWELLGAYLGWLHPTTAVAKKIYDPRFDKLITWLRSDKLKVPMIKRGIALRGILDALRRNWLVYALVDQDTGNDGVFVSFFGKPAWTQSGIARIARKTGAVIVPAFMVRGFDGRFELRVEKEIDVPRTEDFEADVLETVRRYTRVIEAVIRAYPRQWMWMHRRWKTRPPEEISPREAFRSMEPSIGMEVGRS